MLSFSLGRLSLGAVLPARFDAIELGPAGITGSVDFRPRRVFSRGASRVRAMCRMKMTGEQVVGGCFVWSSEFGVTLWKELTRQLMHLFGEEGRNPVEYPQNFSLW